MARHLLNELKIRQVKPGLKPVTLNDGEGLQLVIRPNGSKLWRMRYTFQGKPKLAALGRYPDVSLADARARAMDWRQHVRGGKDPVRTPGRTGAKRGPEPTDTFEVLAMNFLNSDTSVTKGSSARKLQALKKDLFPVIGHRAIGSITADDLLPLIRQIMDPPRSACEQAKRTRLYASQVFEYAAEHGIVSYGHNPAEQIVKAVGKMAVRNGATKGHYAAMPWGEMPRFLRKLDGYGTQFGCTKHVELGIKLLVLTMMRPGSVQNAKWSEFYLDGPNPVWVCTEMKTGKPHVVPLSRQAVAVLRELEPITRDEFEDILLPGASGRKPISEATLVKGLKIMGYTTSTTPATAHGFRATARTYMADRLVPHDVAEWCLAHEQRNATVAAYSRSTQLAQRRVVMQWYADTLDAIKEAGTVVGVKLPLPPLGDLEPEEFPMDLLRARAAVVGK